jgi:hypothetical protein
MIALKHAPFDGRDAFAGAKIGEDARACAIANQNPSRRGLHVVVLDRLASLHLSLDENC